MSTEDTTTAPKITMETIALAAAGLVAFGTIAGSATSLYHIGEHAYPTAPWALPLAIDVTAMVAGLARRADHTSWLARITLFGLTAFSAGLQCYETGSPIAMAVPFGAFLSFELAMHLVPSTLDAPAAPVEEKPLPHGEQLRKQAAAMSIPGRSKMTVAQLEAAVAGKRVPRKAAKAPARPRLVPVAENAAAV